MTIHCDKLKIKKTLKKYCKYCIKNKKTLKKYCKYPTLSVMTIHCVKLKISSHSSS